MTRLGSREQIAATILKNKRLVKAMAEENIPPGQIASAINLSVRTVLRYKREMGIAPTRAQRKITDEEDAEMRRLIAEEGWPITEVARTFNRHVYTLYARYPGMSQVRNGLADTKVLRMKLGLKLAGED